MLEIKELVKDYLIKDNDPVRALDDISIKFGDRGLVCILGPSGCGKTTMLNIIGGLDKYTSGDLIIDGQSTKEYTDQDWDFYRNKRVGIVFQSYNLIPHLTILGNVELAMTLNGKSSKERQQLAKEALISVGLEKEIGKKPNQLSGGQMQRVALARALVNKPSLVLADEPTGALDSVTSVQVMNIFKDISKDKLVVMVTHNEKLANEYADRIIRLEDGKMIADELLNNDLVIKEEIVEEKKEEEQQLIKLVPVSQKEKVEETKKKQHTSMSYVTAVGLSTKNLLTKKGKTIVTSIAASFGIIGVGLVLALSNGFNNYINRMERETLAKFPISIEKYAYDTQTASIDRHDQEIEPYSDEKVVHVVEPTTISFHTNKITNDYIQKLEKINEGKEKDPYCSLRYSYSIGMNVISSYVNQGETIYKSVNTSQQSYVESLASSLIGSSSSYWQELPAEKEKVLETYDLLYGEYPDESKLDVDSSGNPDQKDFGLVLVVTEKNIVSTSIMRQLGLDPSVKDYSFDDMLNLSFKYVSANDYYYEEKETATKQGIFLNENASADDITNAMLGLFGKEGENQLSINDVVDLPSQEEWNRAMALTAITNPLDLATLTRYVNMEKLTSLMSSDNTQAVTIDDIRGCFNNLNTGDAATDKANREECANAMASYLKALLSHAEIKAHFNKDLTCYKSPSNDQAALKEIYNNPNNRNLKIKAILRAKEGTSFGIMSTGIYYPQSLTYQSFYDNSNSKVANEYKKHLLIEAGTNIKNQPEQVFESWFDSIYEDEATITSAMAPITNEFNLKAINVVENLNASTSSSPLDKYLNTRLQLGCDVKFAEGTDYLDPLTYSAFVSSITIYPKDYKSKEYVVSYLQKLNEGKEEEEQVIYTDVGQTATDLVGQIVKIISAVLIAFASISLVVSSVMIGILIYSSVVERTKEIGILRSIGARKKDVSRVFKAEAMIIGFMAGTIGVTFTYLISLPISAILNAVFPEEQLGQICLLNPLHGLALIVISIALTYIASLVPSRIAANKDPVTCLRTE